MSSGWELFSITDRRKKEMFEWFEYVLRYEYFGKIAKSGHALEVICV